MRGDVGTAVRVSYSKLGKIRFVSHRDVARAFERAFRVAQLPVSFSEGFSPHPKVSFGLALSTGYESRAEYLDVELAGDAHSDDELGALVASVAEALPDGLAVTGAAVLEPRTPSLQEAVEAVEYEVEARSLDDTVRVEADAVGEALEALLRAESLVGIRRRKGRDVVDDLRPALRRLSVVGDTPMGVLVHLEVITRPRGARPREILALIEDGSGQGLVEGRVTRTHQWIERDGARWEPLDEPGARRLGPSSVGQARRTVAEPEVPKASLEARAS